MRLVHVCKVWYPRITGVTVHVESLAREMAQSGHRVFVVTYDLTREMPRTRDVDIENHGGFQVVRVRPGSWKLLTDQIRMLKPDVVHTHGIWEHVWPGFFAARSIGADFIMTAHGTWQFLLDTPGFEKKTRQLKYRLYYHTLWRYMVVKARAVIALNAVEIRAHGALGASQLYRIPNGVDCRVFTPGAKLGVSFERFRDRVLNRPYVLFAGSVQAQKGIFTLMEAMEKLDAQKTDIDVVVAGEGPGLEKARDLAKNMKTNIHFLGRVNRRFMPGLMAGASLFVLPSIDEPFATVYLEAMASSTPCVGTATGGTPEIIDKGKNGFLISPGDSDALAGIIEQCSTDPASFRQLGINAREKMKNNYDWPILCQQILRVYETRTH